jgi:hypothetical protein
MLRPRLKKEIRTAIAWGIPDIESIGYTPTMLVGILGNALSYIEYLESKIPEKERYVEIWRDI